MSKTPEYRFRVGEIRVFYDITGNTIEVLEKMGQLRVFRFTVR